MVILHAVIPKIKIKLFMQADDKLLMQTGVGRLKNISLCKTAACVRWQSV